MDGLVELAKMLKERNNPSVQGICIGEVITPPPSLKIMVNGFVLDNSWLVVSKHLLVTYNTSSASVGDHGSHAHTVEDALIEGERVIVIPSVDNSRYYIIDKVGDL